MTNTSSHKKIMTLRAQKIRMLLNSDPCVSNYFVVWSEKSDAEVLNYPIYHYEYDLAIALVSKESNCYDGLHLCIFSYAPNTIGEGSLIVTSQQDWVRLNYFTHTEWVPDELRKLAQQSYIAVIPISKFG